MELGWNSTCYQLLNAGIEHWWSRDRRALVGFVRAGGTAIVAGAPVCEATRLQDTIDEWEMYAAEQQLTVVYFGAEDRLQQTLARTSEYTPVTLGSQPEWRPSDFVLRIQQEPSLRAQLNRARNKGVSVTEWSRNRAENHSELKALLTEWLATRGLPPLHFLVEPETLGDLRDRRVFVAELAGRTVGFVTLCPVPARRGWLTEQFVRGQAAPNGTVELLLFEAAKAVEGDAYFTMGIVPLISTDLAESVAEPKWLRALRTWAKAHYRRFYNFRGLSEFKAKFRPSHWQPVVVIVKGQNFRYRHLRAIGQAFAGTMPERALLAGVRKAILLELERLGKYFPH